MGCFAKGCLAAVIVLFALGLLAGLGGWYFYANVRPFVATAPTVIRTAQPTTAQYAEVVKRIEAFQGELESGRAATLELSAVDLNTYIARSPSYVSMRGKLYLSVVDNQLILEMSVPLSGAKSSARCAGKTYYFNGKLYCGLSYADGDFTFSAHKVETLDGQPAPAFLTAIVSNPDFNRGLSRSFNEGFHGSLHKNPAGEDFMAKVQTISVVNDHVVFTGRGTR